MRILHIFDHSLPLQSGYVSRSLGIIRGQRSRGWETIHLTTPRYHGSTSTHEMVDGFTFYRSPKVSTSTPVLREFREMNATKRALRRVILSERPDILHAHSPVLNALPTIAIGRELGLPVVYEVRALWEDAAVDLGHAREGSLKYRISRRLETYAMSAANRVVALCEPLREEMIARGIPGDRITVVPNAVEPQFLTSARPPDTALRNNLGIGNGPVLGFIGSFYAYEGLDLLLRSVQILSDRIPDFTVLLVGGGFEEDRLRSIVRDLGIERFVRLPGRVPHDEVPRYYGLIDVLVFPRQQMRLTDLVTPLKPLEAMAHSKPIVASDVGGHRELMIDAQSGYLFPAGDVNALAARLQAVLSNPIDAARVGANGRKHVESRLTWNVVVEKYREIYDELLANRG